MSKIKQADKVYVVGIEPRYLRSKDVEKLYGIHHKTLANLRHLGKGPRYIKGERLVLYRPKDIEEWIRKHFTIVETEGGNNGGDLSL